MIESLTCIRTPQLLRKTVGPYFNGMLHFAFTGKKAAAGGGKALTALSKIKHPAMAELLESVLKSCLPNFAAITSNDSMVEKLHQFLANSSSVGSGSMASSGQTASSGGTASNAGNVDEAKFKALVFFTTEGLGVQRLEEGEDNKIFGTRLSTRMNDLLATTSIYHKKSL